MVNLSKLSEKELVEIINTTSDLTLLEKAESEWVDRFGGGGYIAGDPYLEEPESYDDIVAEVRKTFLKEINSLTLTEEYKRHFLDGGAYRRDAWPSGYFWHLNARPPSFNRSGDINQSDHHIPLNTWLGMRWVGTHWISYYVLANEAAQEDWTHMTNEQVNNIIGLIPFRP